MLRHAPKRLVCYSVNIVDALNDLHYLFMIISCFILRYIHHHLNHLLLSLEEKMQQRCIAYNNNYPSIFFLIIIIHMLSHVNNLQLNVSLKFCILATTVSEK